MRHHLHNEEPANAAVVLLLMPGDVTAGVTNSKPSGVSVETNGSWSVIAQPE